MSDSDPPDRDGTEFYDTSTEFCPECGVEQPHHINIEIKTESENYGGNQPYQIFHCQICGNERQERVGFGD